MEHKNEKEGFRYTYSAREQAEIRRIRAKYTPPTEAEDRMVRLRRLDAGVTGSAQAAALVAGVLGALIFGFGMSLFMTDLGELLGLYRAASLGVGIGAGLLGGILAGLAYPIYNAILKAGRKKHAPEIIRLTDELMK